MIILTENNYKPLKKIPHVENNEEIPDIIFYPEIFTDETIEKTTKLLQSLSYNKNGETWLTDDPILSLGEDLPAKPFPALIELIRNDIERITGHSFNSCLIQSLSGDKKHKLFTNEFSWAGDKYVIPSVSFGVKSVIQFESLDGVRQKNIKIKPGSLLIQRERVHEFWNANLLGSNNGTFYNLIFNRLYPPEKISISDCKKVPTVKKGKLPYDLDTIYTKAKYRSAFTEKIQKGLTLIHGVEEDKQCVMSYGVNNLRKYIKMGKLIGTGDWGNVYIAWLAKDKEAKRKFAIKMSRITEDDLKDPYTETSSAWYEIWMLKDIFKPIVEQNVCPNLPLFMDTFLCNKCDFLFRKGDSTHPCVITVMELAAGDMKDYFKFGNASDEELFSALFQIMAGLHSIQMSGQILNNDIKTKNILYYKVKPGGYWHYRINKHDFYVPNFGKMFVLNDFGVSTLYNPNFQLYPNKQKNVFNLGSRYAINVDGKFSPIDAEINYGRDGSVIRQPRIKWVTSEGELVRKSRGVTYKIDRKTGQVLMSRTNLTPFQKSYLFKNGVTTNPKTWGFFEHPFYIPPFEFYNDVQDTLRTFVGGKRTTQRGNHSSNKIVSKTVQNAIVPYMGKQVNAKEKVFTDKAYHVLAGEFIIKFFTETYSYKNKPKGKKIGYYDMNKCLSKKY
jgi:hypothetical protein